MVHCSESESDCEQCTIHTLIMLLRQLNCASVGKQRNYLFFYLLSYKYFLQDPCLFNDTKKNFICCIVARIFAAHCNTGVGTYLQVFWLQKDDNRYYR